MFLMNYYNKNVEVDFCVPDDGLLVQVSYRITDDTARNREIVALQKTAKFIKGKEMYDYNLRPRRNHPHP